MFSSTTRRFFSVSAAFAFKQRTKSIRSFDQYPPKLVWSQVGDVADIYRTALRECCKERRSRVILGTGILASA